MLFRSGRDLQNLIAREARHHRNRDDSVELAESAGNSSASGDALGQLEREETIAGGRAFMEELIRDWTEAERQCLRLQLDGERHTAAFALAMGLGDLPADEQQRQVKQMKDRVNQRLARRRETDG